MFKNMQKIVETGNASPKASPVRNLSSLMKDKVKGADFAKERADTFRVRYELLICYLL